MEINSNLSTTGVNAGIQASRPTPAKQMPSDGVSLLSSSNLEQALQNVPASRPEVVEKARSLIADPSYPSASVLNSVAQHLATNMFSENQ